MGAALKSEVLVCEGRHSHRFDAFALSYPHRSLMFSPYSHPQLETSKNLVESDVI
jgi:hypothetical protein